MEPAVASDVLSLLTPSVVTKIVSRLRPSANFLSRFFGFEIGGKNVFQVQGNTYTYDIYDHVRDVARGRLPGAPSGSVSANPLGNVQVTLARSAEKLGLDYELVNHIRVLGENAGTHDIRGRVYIEKQAMTLRQRSENLREFVTAGALFNGGIYGFYINGDDLVPTLARSGTYISVDHRMNSNFILTGGSFAAGLPMDTGSNIVTATWATAGTDIPQQLDAISGGFVGAVGQPLRYIFINSTLKNYVLQNDKVRQLAGTSNTPFATMETMPFKNPDGTDAGVRTFTLKGLPYYTWIVYDGQLRVATTDATTFANTKMLADSYATFMIEPDNAWFQMVEGSEIVKDNDIAPAVERTGFYAWIMEKADPARFELHNLQRVGLELNIPKGIAWARVM
jgi:hypothetical protein